MSHRQFRLPTVVAVGAFVLANALSLDLSGCATANVKQTVAASLKIRSDTAAELFRPDRITTVLVGTGGPMPSRRAQASTAVFVGGQFLLFDCGDGSARELEALGLPVARLDEVFLTHFHSDHFADLGEVIDRSWVNGRRQKLAVFGPEGAADITGGFVSTYAIEYGYRTAHHGPAMMPPEYSGAMASEFTAPVDDGDLVVYDKGGVVVRAFRAEHPPIRPGVGYRIEYAGKVIVISGDTIATETLKSHSKGADLLVAEVMSKSVVSQMEIANRSLGNDFNANILRDIREYHMDVTDLANLAREAGVKRLALTHLAPPMDNQLQANLFFAKPIKAIYKGEVILGPDGTRVVVEIK